MADLLLVDFERFFSDAGIPIPQDIERILTSCRASSYANASLERAEYHELLNVLFSLPDPHGNFLAITLQTIKVIFSDLLSVTQCVMMHTVLKAMHGMDEFKRETFVNFFGKSISFVPQFVIIAREFIQHGVFDQESCQLIEHAFLNSNNRYNLALFVNHKFFKVAEALLRCEFIGRLSFDAPERYIPIITRLFKDRYAISIVQPFFFKRWLFKLPAVNTMQELFNSIIIQKLFDTQELYPWQFLFSAVYAGDDAEFMFFLSHEQCCPWSLNERGYSLIQAINASDLNADDKQARIARVYAEIKKRQQAISDNAIEYHFAGLSLVPDSANLPELVKLPNLIVPNPYVIPEVSQEHVNLFHRYINWFCYNESIPKIYRDQVHLLDSNERIRNKNDYNSVFKLLKHVCELIQYLQANNKSIPNIGNLDASLDACPEGVRTWFMSFIVVLSMPPYLRFVNTAMEMATSKFRELFITYAGNEPHVDMRAIAVEMGLEYHASSYDPSILDWQLYVRSVAQEAMGNMSRDDWIASAIDSLQSLLLSGDEWNLDDPDQRDQLVTIYDSYKSSGIFTDEFDYCAFLSFISGRGRGQFGKLFNAVKDPVYGILRIRPDLVEHLKQYAESFLVVKGYLTERNLVVRAERLLWSFLTCKNFKTINERALTSYSAILKTCVTSVDGLAFVKKCIELHAGELEKINYEAFLWSPEGTSMSLYRALASHPFYGFWMYGKGLCLVGPKGDVEVSAEQFKIISPELALDYPFSLENISAQARPSLQSDDLALSNQSGGLFFTLTRLVFVSEAWSKYFLAKNQNYLVFQGMTYTNKFSVLLRDQNTRESKGIIMKIMQTFKTNGYYDRYWAMACYLTGFRIPTDDLMMDRNFLASLRVEKNWHAIEYLAYSPRELTQVRKLLRDYYFDEGAAEVLELSLRAESPARAGMFNSLGRQTARRASVVNPDDHERQEGVAHDSPGRPKRRREQDDVADPVLPPPNFG